MEKQSATILVVDDNEMNRHLLSRMLKKLGYQVVLATNGKETLVMMQTVAPDLVLLDIMMPEMDGYEVLEYRKNDGILRHIPVVMITAVDDIESVVRCIELGAEDYLLKPFNPILLQARIDASLEKKQLRDHEQAYYRQMLIEREKSERLLLSILPAPIAHRLKQGEQTIADFFPNATVLFADIVGFTQVASTLTPRELVELLNTIFSLFDTLAAKHGVEKIKTMGDSYLVAGGVPIARPDHAAAIADMALDMQDTIVAFCMDELHHEIFLNMRIGIHTGPVIAGIIGNQRFIYDIWGDTVNIASRMETAGLAGCIQTTETVYEQLKETFAFEPRGLMDVKGIGKMKTYFLKGRK
jgi:class 3 adenylate cyclase/CheY-like chemotaxis protein